MLVNPETFTLSILIKEAGAISFLFVLFRVEPKLVPKVRYAA